ncbi:MAG: TonB-dependent receptor, partial [Spirosoma sp.]|nr:TonB-dependent receptor [Spirosoma sp.]
TTNARGMGSVVMTPQEGQTYYAEVLDNNQRQLVPLPPVERAGFCLSADAVSDTSRLLLTIMGTNRPATDSVYILIQQQGRLVDGRKIQLQSGVARVSLPMTQLPPGLNQVTLYDDAARPQAERLVFLPERVPPIRVVLGVNKTRYVPREQAIMSITLNDDGLPTVAALSASITDAEQVPGDTAAATIRTHLLLTGELRGRVEQPNTYLKSNSSETRRALDDLLLTQGWRRLSGTPATERLGGVSLTGRVLDAKNKPLTGAQVVVASTVPGQSFVRSAGADERGRFRLAGLAIADTVKLLVQLTDRQLKDIPAKDARLVLEGPLRSWEPDTSNILPNWTLLRTQLAAARIRQENDADFYRDKNTKLLKEVTVRARKFDERPDDIKRRSLHNVSDGTIIFDETATRLPNLYEMIRGRLAGVSVLQGQNGGYRVLVRGVSSIMGSTTPLFLLDGVPIQDEDGTALLAFNPGDIERVEVLKNAGSAGIYGVRGGNGVIAFYTKSIRSGQVEKKPKAGMIPLQLIGFPSVQREFYVPRYDPKPEESQSAASSRVDRRDVLYWKPVIQTDSQGRTQLIFPLSDVVRTLRVMVQGVTTDGRPVVGEALLRVQ